MTEELRFDSRLEQETLFFSTASILLWSPPCFLSMRIRRFLPGDKAGEE
jgi:hypothetical protein